MKHSLCICFLLALLVNGCTQEEMLKNGTSVSGKGRTFTTSFEKIESRTYLEEGRFSRWTEGDRISLFDGNTLNGQYLFAGETGDSGGTFFMLNKPEGTSSSLAANYAVYPYSEDVAMIKEGEISVSLPTEQHYAENSYGLGDNTMVAVTENVDDTFLRFKNVGGAFKLQLYGDDVTVKSIILKGNNDEKIAGKAMITAAYGEAPVVTMADDATNFIILDCGDKGVKIGSSATESTAFWVVVPPTTFEKGITIMVTDIDGKEFIQTTDKQLFIERNVVKPMAAVKAVMEPTSPKLFYTRDKEVLDEWVEGLFCNDGIYYLAKPSGYNGCLVTLGNLMTDENCTYFIDENRQVREVFFGDNIFTFNNYTDYSVDISFFDESGIRITETVTRNIAPVSRSTGDHGQQADGINLGLNMLAIKDAVTDIAQKETSYKYGRGWQSYTLNVFNALGTAFELGGGSENAFFSNKFVDIVGTLDNLWGLGEMGLELYKSLKIKDVKLKIGPGGPAIWAATAWLGFYATYLELFDEHIQVYYGDAIASIDNIKYQDNTLNIDLEVSGYVNIYNMDCGVIVRKSNLLLAPPAGRFPSNAVTKTVTQNGENSFSVGGIELAESYWIYPFLVSKSRDSLWIGFIGNMAGPLVRYGKAVSYKTPSPSGQLLSIENVKRNSAVVKCQFSNVGSGVECGIIISNNEGYNQKQTVSNTEEEQLVTISGLEPLTEYTCTPYVKLIKSEGGVYYKEGNSISFTTSEPEISISGTWKCTETHYNLAGTPSYKTYFLTLNDDGSVEHSESDVYLSSWYLAIDGEVSISIVDFYTNTVICRVNWEGHVNDINNPTKINGIVYNSNNGINGNYIEFEMTR